MNLFVARYERRKATSWAAPCFDADARHTQSDLYASAAVVASFVAVRAGISLGGRRGDPAAGGC